MADTLTNVTIKDSGSELIVHHHYVSDGTGTTDGVVVDKSAFTVSGAEPGTLRVMAMRWAIQGMSYALLEWNRGTDVVIARLSGNGYENWMPDGKGDTGSGGDGDIVITPTGVASGATIDLTLWLRKE